MDSPPSPADIEALPGCRSLGEQLRHWCLQTAAAGQEPPSARRLQAVLLDGHQPSHGDPILYEYLLRRQGFQALVLAAPRPAAPATTHLAMLALIAEARGVFTAASLRRMAAFLEGFTGLSGRLEAGTPAGPTVAMPPAAAPRQESGSPLAAPQASAKTAASGAPSALAPGPSPSVGTGGSGGAGQPSAPHQRQPVSTDRVRQLQATALQLALRTGQLTPQQSNQVHGGRWGLFHYHLTDAAGRSLARIHGQMLRAGTGAPVAAGPQMPTPQSSLTAPSAAPQPGAVRQHDPQFIAALDLAERRGLLTPEQSSRVHGGSRGLLHYHLKDAFGNDLAKVHLGLLQNTSRR
ncbi:MAG: hypothetical protein ACKO0M_02980 [Cyanobium sp.]